VNFQFPLSKIPLYLVYFILATVPLLFGAVHPIFYGSYVFLVLVGLGSWLCLFVPEQDPPLLARFWLLPIIILLFFSAFQSMPLPFSWVDLISPARALRVEMVNTLAGTEQNYISISDHGLLSLTRVVLFLALLVYYLSIKALMRHDEKIIRILVFIIIAVGVFEALYGILQFLSPRLGVLWLTRKYAAACGTIIYKNQYASFLNMCWPLSLAVAACYLADTQHFFKGRKFRSLRERIKRMGGKEKLIPIFFLATGIILLAVLFSMSRGGMISMLLVMLLLNVYLPGSRRGKVGFFALFCLFAIVYGSLLGLDTLVSRFDNIDVAGSSRLKIYMSSLPLLMDHWLSGIGLGSYSLLSPIYLKGIPSAAHFDKAHNEYLQLAIELGIPAVVLFFTWLSLAMVLAGKHLFQKREEEDGKIDFVVVIGGGAFCGLLGFFFHGVADFGWRLPANLFYAVTLAALVSHATTKIQGTTGKGHTIKGS
jgi:O-antigen ligase